MRLPVVGFQLGRQALLAATAASLAGTSSRPAYSASTSLADRLASRDPKQLAKPFFNVAPAEATYPEWLDGEWKASLSFDGYELPAKDLIPREQLFAEPNVPGFQKCSIAFLPDVGKEGVTFPMRWARDASGKVREDRAFNLREAIRGGLG